ncbi:MAG: DUF2383 domain-containing protein [Oscillospiraceae bacterium]|jgi:hypothetical protein
MKNKNLELLNDLYQNTSMGISTLSTIIPRTNDEKLKGELQAQLKIYNDENQKITDKLYAMNEKPEDISRFTKTYADMSIALSTAVNHSTSHIAEMMIQGTDMGIIQMNRTLNNNYDVDTQIKSQAEKLLKAQQAYIDKLKTFL